MLVFSNLGICMEIKYRMPTVHSLPTQAQHMSSSHYTDSLCIKTNKLINGGDYSYFSLSPGKVYSAWMLGLPTGEEERQRQR